MTPLEDITDETRAEILGLLYTAMSMGDVTRSISRLAGTSMLVQPEGTIAKRALRINIEVFKLQKDLILFVEERTDLLKAEPTMKNKAMIEADRNIAGAEQLLKSIEAGERP